MTERSAALAASNSLDNRPNDRIVADLRRDIEMPSDPTEAPVINMQEWKARQERLKREKERMLERAQHLVEQNLHAHDASVLAQAERHGIPLLPEEKKRLQDIREQALIHHAAFAATAHEVTAENVGHPALLQEPDVDNVVLQPAEDAPDTGVQHAPLNEPDVLNRERATNPESRQAATEMPAWVDDYVRTFTREERGEEWHLPEHGDFEGDAEVTQESEVPLYGEEKTEEIVLSVDEETRYEKFIDERYSVARLVDEMRSARSALVHTEQQLAQARSLWGSVKRLFGRERDVRTYEAQLAMAQTAYQEARNGVTAYFDAVATSFTDEEVQKYLVSSPDIAKALHRELSQELWGIENKDSRQYRERVSLKNEYIHIGDRIDVLVKWKGVIADARARAYAVCEQILRNEDESLAYERENGVPEFTDVDVVDMAAVEAEEV